LKAIDGQVEGKGQVLVQIVRVLNSSALARAIDPLNAGKSR